MRTEVKIEEPVYLDAPSRFVEYECKGKDYQLMVDGATGTALKGNILPTGFRTF